MASYSFTAMNSVLKHLNTFILQHLWREKGSSIIWNHLFAENWAPIYLFKECSLMFWKYDVIWHRRIIFVQDTRRFISYHMLLPYNFCYYTVVFQKQGSAWYFEQKVIVCRLFPFNYPLRKHDNYRCNVQSEILVSIWVSN